MNGWWKRGRRGKKGCRVKRYEAVRAGEKEGKERLRNTGVMIVGREVRRRREKMARATFTDVWITLSHSYDSWQAQLVCGWTIVRRCHTVLS